MKFKATVFVRVRGNVSDSAGNAVKQNVNRVSDVDLDVSTLRIGKVIDIEFESPSEEEAKDQLAILSDRLLANTVIEDWSYELQVL